MSAGGAVAAFRPELAHNQALRDASISEPVLPLSAMWASQISLRFFRFRAPSSGFAPERIGRLGHPLVCVPVGPGRRGPDGVGGPLPGGGRDVDVQPAGPFGRSFVQRERDGRPQCRPCSGYYHSYSGVSSPAARSRPPGWLDSRRGEAFGFHEKAWQRRWLRRFWHPAGNSATVSRLVALTPSPAPSGRQGNRRSGGIDRRSCGLGLLDN